MGHRITSLAVVAATILGMSVAIAGPAAAAEKSESNSCWADAVTMETLCVEPGEDLVAAVLREKGVQISAPVGTVIGGKTVQESNARSQVGILSAALSIIYDDINYGGGSFVMTGNNPGCTDGSSYGFVSLSAIGWRGRVSSFKSFTGCRTAVFDLEYYGGASYGYTTQASQLGAMNDKADSWRAAP